MKPPRRPKSQTSSQEKNLQKMTKERRRRSLRGWGQLLERLCSSTWRLILMWWFMLTGCLQVWGTPCWMSPKSSSGAMPIKSVSTRLVLQKCRKSSTKEFNTKKKSTESSNTTQSKKRCAHSKGRNRERRDPRRPSRPRVDQALSLIDLDYDKSFKSKSCYNWKKKSKEVEINCNL